MHKKQLDSITNWFVAQDCDIAGSDTEGMVYTVDLPKVGRLELRTDPGCVYIWSGLGLPEDYAFEVHNPTPELLILLKSQV